MYPEIVFTADLDIEKNSENPYPADVVTNQVSTFLPTTAADNAIVKNNGSFRLSGKNAVRVKNSGYPLDADIVPTVYKKGAFPWFFFNPNTDFDLIIKLYNFKNNQYVVGYLNDSDNVNHFMCVKFNQNGVDTSFANNGCYIAITLPNVDEFDTCNAMTFDSQDRIILAGYVDNVGAGGLIRLFPNGDEDHTFNGTGRIVQQFPGSSFDNFDDVIVQPDGKIIAAGRGGNSKCGMVRYNDDGTIDTSFGVNGFVVTDLGGAFQGIFDIYLLNDKIVTVAQYGTGFTTSKLGLIQYNLDGSLDTSYGDNGVVLTTILRYYGSCSVMQSDGKIVFLGTNLVPSPQPNYLVRYNTDGSPDTSFTNQTIQGMGSNTLFIDAMITKADDSIILGCTSWTAGFTQAFRVLLGYKSDGQVDTSFGVQGVAFDSSHIRFLSAPTVKDVLPGLATDPTGAIYGAGGCDNFDEQFIAKYTPNGFLDHTYGA